MINSVIPDFYNFRLSLMDHQENSKTMPIKIRTKRFYEGAFLRGPVPLNWLQRAMDLGPAAISAGIILWYFQGLKKSIRFKIGIQDLAKLINSSRSTAQRGLIMLGKNALIKIE